MGSKQYCIEKYKEYKKLLGRAPLYSEYKKYAELKKYDLIKIYGDDAYSKLQTECGDTINKLNMDRTPLKNIMCQYGDLALELGKLPLSSNWVQKGLKPGLSGLDKIHSIKWFEFPEKFKEWVENEKYEKYETVLEWVNNLTGKSKLKAIKEDATYEKLIDYIRLWSPGRRRNSEGEYKIELRKYLELAGYQLNEEFGESNFDLLINKKYAIEIKKDPNLAEYDRLFGQLGRHLQHQINIIALIMDVPSEDKLENFNQLVDLYLNRDNKRVEVIKK
jgi:hypothetical protein